MTSPFSSRRSRARTAAVVLSTAVRVTTILALGLGLGAVKDLAGQERAGRITGRVLSGQNAEPLINAQVYVPALKLGALTGLDGRYMLRVPAGTHDLTVEYVGYATKTITGISVTGDAPVSLDITMMPQAIAFEEITVTATRERGSSTSLLTERKKAALVVDAIGSEQIAKSPDGDAAAALRRVPGISVVDGKYVYVRGLGERYGNTTLNGAPLPSPETDRKVVPLDIIPSSLLESVVTAKTYSPDQPGDYAGGLVQVRTRDFTGFRTFKIGTSFGYNSAASFQDGLGYAGGRYDFLGYDDGTRGLPSTLPPDRPVLGLAAADLERIGESFGGAWGPTPKKVPVDQGFGLTFGDEYEIGDRAFSFLGSVTQSNSYTRRDDAIERVLSSAGAADPEVDYRGFTTTHSASLGALLNLGLRIAPTHRVTLATVYNRVADDEARVFEGYNVDSNTDQRNTRIRYLAQTLVNTQLSGEHVFGALNNTNLRWRAALSSAGRYEPNTRDVLYRRSPDGTIWLWENFIQSGSIFHQDMTEDGLSGGIDLKIPFTFRSLPASIAFGGSTDRRDRTAYTRRFRFIPAAPLAEEVRVLEPDELFTPVNIGPDGFQVQEATFRADNYDAEQSVDAGYAMIDVELLPRLRLVGGVRVEAARQAVDPRDLFATPLPPVDGARLDNTDLLPGVNLSYALTEGMNLRLGASRTLARPQLRELAPFSFADYAGGSLVVGNPLLERSRIENYDVRWEWFPAPGALFAVSAFYKRFDDPIEVLVFPSTELIKSWVNADHATNYGSEIELRSSLGFLGAALENVTVNANLTLVASEVATGSSVVLFLPGSGPFALSVVDTDRALQGQSPYVVNGGVSYYSERLGTSATVLYNRFGRRIETVGSQSLPDIYEEARDQLDLVLEQPLTAGFSVKLAANRLLGNEVRFTQGGDLVRQYDSGRTFSFSASWSPGGK